MTENLLKLIVGYSKGFKDRVVFGHFAVSIPCPNLSDHAIPE